MDEPLCPICGTPEKQHHKFNNGNPIWVWLPECDCEEQAFDAEIDRRFGAPTASPEDE